MEISEEFSESKYIHIQNFISEEQANILKDTLVNAIDVYGWNDPQCSKSKSLRNNSTLDDILEQLLPDVEETTGFKLLPTHAYARLYVSGEELKPLTDRPACEISATITLGFEGNSWPIFIGTPSTEKTDLELTDQSGKTIYIENSSKIEMSVGSAIIYKGCELYHWREPYVEGKWQVQIFLHYVDANGPNKDWIYDKRESLSNKQNKVNVEDAKDDLTYWYYDDILTPQDCDVLIQVLSNQNKIKAGIGIGKNQILDESIRKVEKVILPTHKSIGALLTSAGIDANSQRWNFDIKKSNQCEFLHYPSGGGKYKGHMDTFLSKKLENQHECRKITVLAFLNDDFKGGKFFLQTGSTKFYPPQSKGNVLVFPSFLLHGVEDVEEGNRYSVVTWLVGPWFK